MRGPYKFENFCDCKCNDKRCLLFVEERGTVCGYCSKHCERTKRVKRVGPRTHRYTSDKPDF